MVGGGGWLGGGEGVSKETVWQEGGGGGEDVEKVELGGRQGLTARVGEHHAQLDSLVKL